MKRGWTWKAGAAAAVVTAGVLATTVAAFPAGKSAPKPVYGKSAADPGIVRAGNNFYMFSTSKRATAAKGAHAAGSWKAVGASLDLSKGPSWVSTGHAVWAPDVVHTSAGYVMYYSAVAKKFGDQRCIGAATSDKPAGPYKPVGNKPLVCPGGRHGGEDPAKGRPIANVGVIDPSPFVDSKGRRYVLYKTQKRPSSIRMLRVGSHGAHAVGASRELVQSSGIIEAPVMSQRGGHYVLFASRYAYNSCEYTTVYLRSKNRWNFHRAAEHKLLTHKGTGICGPGGADVAHALGKTGFRLFLHGWTCKGTTPCTDKQVKNNKGKRVLYAAVLTWGKDGSTPHVRRFL